MSREKKIFDEYFGVDFAQEYSKNKDFDQVLQCMNLRIPFDDKKCGGPDFYAIDGSTVMIIEHFSFDSSDKNRGSTARKEMADLHKQFNKSERMLSEPISSKVTMPQPIRNYVENAKCAFRKHMDKIPDYFNNLRTHGLIPSDANTMVSFVIEDVTEQGSVYNDGNLRDGVPAPALFLTMCDEFLDFFEEQDQVDFLFCLSRSGESRVVKLLASSNIHDYREQQISVKEQEELGLVPCTVYMKTRALADAKNPLTFSFYIPDDVQQVGSIILSVGPPTKASKE